MFARVFVSCMASLDVRVTGRARGTQDAFLQSVRGYMSLVCEVTF